MNQPPWTPYGPPVPRSDAVPPPPAAPPALAALPVFTPPVPPKSGTRLVVGLVAGALVLLCCLGGVAGLVGLGVYGYSANREVVAVTVYLEALRTSDFDNAYRQLCDPAQERQTREEFVSEQTTQARLVDYEIAEPEEDADATLVGARLRYADRTVKDEVFTVVTESDGVRVCP